MPAPNGYASAEETAPAGDVEAAAGGMTYEMELLKKAAKEGPAADETIEPAILKSVAGDTDEIADQGNAPTDTTPDHNLRGTASRGCFRSLELLRPAQGGCCPGRRRHG